MSIVPSFDLAAAVRREQPRVPSHVMALPSMLSYDERVLLHWAARVGFGATGAIVDAGCFLGGSTLPLGLGMLSRESAGPAPGGSRIHSFDLFQVGEERERVYFDGAFRFEVGRPTLDLYVRNIAAIRDRVTVHAGDINGLVDWSEDISLLFIDIAKSWETNDTVVKQFFPHLVPDAIVIQQDLIHFGHPWCALTMELLSEHFEYLGFVPFSSAVYRVRSPVSHNRLPTSLKGVLSADESVELIRRCAERVNPPYDGYVRLAAACALGYYNLPDRAREIIAQVGAKYTDETLPWISEHIAMVSQFVNGAQGRSAQR
jgi:hypothetical protein